MLNSKYIGALATSGRTSAIENVASRNPILILSFPTVNIFGNLRNKKRLRYNKKVNERIIGYIPLCQN